METKPRFRAVSEVSKSEIEDLLLDPIEKHTQNLWVYENDEMVYRSISYVPELYRIFDEILVTAAYVKKRDPSMDSLKVTIDAEANTVSVYNNGIGFPVKIHKKKKVFVPELIFGPVLPNIFSTEYVIEAADGRRLKKYKQVFSNNMRKKSEPTITKCKANENWTKVTFKPDLEKFKMAYLEEDVVALMKKRVLDMTWCLGKGVKVKLNGTLLRIKSFKDYADFYLKSAEKSRSVPLPRIHAKAGDRWEICVSLSDGQFQQVSFVDSIATIKGGTHVDYITNQIATYVMNKVNKKQKDANVKAHNVKNHLWVFVNALIDNPAFDSQTKEALTTRQARFGSKCDLPKSLLKNVANSGVLKAVMLANLERNVLMLDNQLRFLLQVANGGLNVMELEKADLLMELEQKGFTLIPQVAGSNEDKQEELEAGYEYLVSLPIGFGFSLYELVGELLIEKDKKENEYRTLMTDFDYEVSESEESDDDDSDMLQSAEGTETSSPEKKVRRIGESSFNKKSGSILGRAANKDKSPGEDLSFESCSGTNSPLNFEEEVVEVAPPQARLGLKYNIQ